MSNQPVELEAFAAELPRAGLYLIGGPTGSGKSALGQAIRTCRKALVVAMDDYFLDRDHIVSETSEEYGSAPQWTSPDAYDLPLLITNITELLSVGQTLMPKFSHAQDRRTGYDLVTRQDDQPMVIEGLYAIRYRDQITPLGINSLAVYVTANEVVRTERIRLRDFRERGQDPATFDKRLFFIRLGERRWVVEQYLDADITLDTSAGFA